MLKTLTIFAILLVYTCHRVSSLASVDYRVNLLRQGSVRTEGDGEGGGEGTSSTTAAPEPVCKSGGLVCKSCSEVYACMLVGGTYKPIKAQDCATGESCINGVCTKAPNPTCTSTLDVFICNSVGMFPDPFNCSKFHMCSPDANGNAGPEAKGSCVGKYAYNSKTTFCDKKLVGGQCSADYPVPICNAMGQTAPLKENPSIYYYCLPHEKNVNVLYPYLFNCDNGGLYDAKTQTCKTL